MEPMTIAASFATIVSLYGMFRAERRAGESANYDDYIGWLQSHQHDQLIELLASNSVLAQSTKGLVESQHDEVMEALTTINQVITNIAAHLSATKELATALSLESQISGQAISILRQLNELGATRFSHFHARLREACYITAPVKRELALSEPRFIEDDINKLCSHGLVTPGYGSQGEVVYTITRAGARLGEQ